VVVEAAVVVVVEEAELMGLLVRCCEGEWEGRGIGEGRTHGFVYLGFCFFGKLVVVVARGGAVGWKAAWWPCRHHGDVLR
jgi:hypothetical protein